MNTKKAIELIEHVSWNRFGNYGYDNNREEMIELLRRGEKFEKIVYEIDERLIPGALTPSYDGLNSLSTLNFVKLIIEDIKQKYFPKPIKKTITIRIKGDGKNVKSFIGWLHDNSVSKLHEKDLSYQINTREGD